MTWFRNLRGNSISVSIGKMVTIFGSDEDMPKTTIDGTTHTFHNSITIDRHSTLILDGISIGNVSHIPKIVVEGDVSTLNTAGSAEVNGNAGPVDAGGSVTVAGNVSGKVDAGGSVKIGGNIGGNVDAGGSVTATGTISGNIDAGGSVRINSVKPN